MTDLELLALVARALNLVLWVALVVGAIIYWYLGVSGRRRRTDRHEVMTRTAYLTVVLSGAGAIGFFLGDAAPLLAMVLVGVRTTAVAATWLLVLYDLDPLRPRPKKAA